MEEVQNKIIKIIEKELNNIIKKQKLEEVLNIINTKPLDIWLDENSELFNEFIPTIVNSNDDNTIKITEKTIKNAREIVLGYNQIKTTIQENPDRRLLNFINEIIKITSYLPAKLEYNMPVLKTNMSYFELDKLLDQIKTERINYKILEDLKERKLINENEYKNFLTIVNADIEVKPLNNEIDNKQDDIESVHFKEEPQQKEKTQIIKIMIPKEEDLNNPNTITLENNKPIKIIKPKEEKEDLTDILSKEEATKNNELLWKIASQIFICEIDKLNTYEQKILKIDELLNNNMYGNNQTSKSNTIEILLAIIKSEILDLQEITNDENETKDLYRLITYLRTKNIEIDEEIPNDEYYFDYNNHKNKVVYLSNSIVKDVENIEDSKAKRDIFNLLNKIKADNIPIKSVSMTEYNGRKIKRIRTNSNNSQVRIICEQFPNSTYGIILIETQKSTTYAKQEQTTIQERIKNYNPLTILNNIDNDNNQKIDESIYDLVTINSKKSPRK